jgi:hypothetical protein
VGVGENQQPGIGLVQLSRGTVAGTAFHGSDLVVPGHAYQGGAGQQNQDQQPEQQFITRFHKNKG